MINIGGFNIEFGGADIFEMKNRFKNYMVDGKIPDLTLDITQQDVENERAFCEFKTTDLILAFNAVHRRLAEWLPLQNAFVLHSAVFDVEGTGIALAAISGTGKTTHLMLWQKLLGEKMTVINGDKPIVRFFDDQPYPFAYGTPWKGKEKLGNRARTPLKHICLITRAAQNSVRPLEKSEAVSRLLTQVYMPADPKALLATIELTNRIISCCSLWEICCNMEQEAAKVAYEGIFGRNI